MAISQAAYVAPGERLVTKEEERRVIVASSVGTVFEWYDFYLYAILAPFFAACSSRRATRPPPSSAPSAPTPRASSFARSAP